jgi:hypothetical protein
MSDELTTWSLPAEARRPGPAAPAGHEWPDAELTEVAPLPPPLETSAPPLDLTFLVAEPPPPPPVENAGSCVPVEDVGNGVLAENADNGVPPAAAQPAAPNPGRYSAGGAGWNIRQNRPAPANPWETNGAPVPAQLTPAYAGAGYAALQPLPWEMSQRKAPVSTRALFGFSLLLRVALIIALPVVAFVAFGWHSWFTNLFHTNHNITQPYTFASLTLVNNPSLTATASSLTSDLTKRGATQAVVAYYGTNDHPELILVLAKGQNKSQTPLEGFTEYAHGLSASGFNVDTAAVTDTKSNGTDFMCAPVTGPVLNGAVSTCMWDDYDVIGAVLDITGQPVGKTYSQAVAARAAGEH